MSLNTLTAYPWVLYLNPEIHINEYKIVKNANLESLISLQDSRQCATEDIPPWLSVLPVLVDTKKMVAYRGTSCLQKLVSIDLPPEHLKRIARQYKIKWTA